jgi:hypothetical protein
MAEQDMTSIKQLYALEATESGERTSKQPVFPATLTRSVYDPQTGQTLDSILRSFNSLYLDYAGTSKATRLSVLPILRRKGLLITYRDLYGVTVTERCEDDSEKDTEAFGEDACWTRIFYIDNLRADIIDRGTWDQKADYYAGGLRPETGRYEVSDTWLRGCRYRCRKNGTKEQPGWQSKDWLMIEGNPDFTLDFVEPDTICDPETFNTTLTLTARLYNTEIIDDIDPKDIVWTRESLDAKGERRTESDAIWNARRGNSGRSIRLTREDIDGDTEFPSKLTFTATVTIAYEGGEATESVSYEYE